MARFSFNPIKPLNNFLLSFLSKYSVQQEEVIGLDLTPRSVNLIQLSKLVLNGQLRKCLTGQLRC